MQRLRTFETIAAQLGRIPSTGISQLGRLLEEFAHELSEHFDMDEASDLYTTYIDEFPELSLKLLAVRDQHRALRRQLNALREKIVRAEAGTRQSDFAHGLYYFIKGMRAHECAEAALIHRVHTGEPPRQTSMAAM